MKNKYVWICDYCGKEFPTKEKSDRHELKCPKRKEKDFKVVINFGKINQKKIFNSTLLFLVVYLMLFGLITSYAKVNNLPSKNLLKPSEWLGKKNEVVEEKITPTPTPNEIITPTPTVKSQVNSSSNQNTANSTSDQIECIGPDGKQFQATQKACDDLNKAWGKQTDSIVNCNVNSNCGGGTKKMKKSECDNSTCCKIGDTWYFYTSKQKCNNDQSKFSSNNYTVPTSIPASTYEAQSGNTPIPTSSYNYIAPTQRPISTIDQQAIEERISRCQGDCIRSVDSYITSVRMSCRASGGWSSYCDDVINSRNAQISQCQSECY